MYDDPKRDVASTSKTKRKNDSLPHHLNERPCIMKSAGEVGTRNSVEDRSVIPSASWPTQCPLL